LIALQPIVFVSLPSLYAALALVGLMAIVARFRRVAIRTSAQIILAIGALLLATASGRPTWNRPKSGTVAVMVDLSPSTRGATFRDRLSLDRRIHQLLGDRQYQLLAFSDRNQPLTDNSPLLDLPCDRTVFSPPAVDAIVLFSDGQFELPSHAPPTYPVIDPAMDHPSDAAITDLSQLGHQILASTASTTRPIHWTGATPTQNPSIANPTNTAEVTATLSPGDLWPENDSLTLALPSPLVASRWWLGTNCPAGWQTIANLPANPADYLQPGAIVLNNIPADSLSSEQQQHLVQYVRDIGGALVIVGGNHAFAAGGYDGSLLDDLSPLASSPPQPAMRWTLLIDGSGSMTGEPWKTEVAAVTRLLPQLPANDLLSIGSFAQSLNWWTHDIPAATASRLHLPPEHVQPNGPTNLAAALSQIVSSSDGSSPTQLMLMTDADADLPNPADLSALMIAKKIHVYLLALGNGSALPALRSIAAATGGQVLVQLDPGQWIASANQLLRTAMPDRYQHQLLNLIPGPGSVAQWNQTWAKPAATVTQKSSLAPMIARWHAGIGQVISIAYPADDSTIQSLARQIAQLPTDPRFQVKWDAGSTLHITVNAMDHDQFLNNQSLTLEMLDPRAQSAAPAIMPIPQTAPGLYEIKAPAPRSSVFITVKEQSNALRRFAVAGRYPPEFDAIGNNLPNLKSLGDRSGGTIIPPGPTAPIDFHWPRKQSDLTSKFAIAGFLVIGSGLVADQRRFRRRSRAAPL
jgi:hypothetical protein